MKLEGTAITQRGYRTSQVPERPLIRVPRWRTHRERPVFPVAIVRAGWWPRLRARLRYRLLGGELLAYLRVIALPAEGLTSVPPPVPCDLPSCTDGVGGITFNVDGEHVRLCLRCCDVLDRFEVSHREVVTLILERRRRLPPPTAIPSDGVPRLG